MSPPPCIRLLTHCARLTTTFCQCALYIRPLSPPSTTVRRYSAPSPRTRKLRTRQDSTQSRLSKEEALRRYSMNDFPIGPFTSARKAKAVPFTAATALDIIRRYAELRGDIDPNSKAEAEHGKALCEGVGRERGGSEFNIRPNTLTLIGLTLHKSTSSSSHLRATSIHLLTLAHELKDPHATILLYHRMLNSIVPPDHEPFRKASREAMIRRYLDRIEHYAKSARDPVSMFIWGDYLATNNTSPVKEAKEWLRAAGENGVGKAWSQLGAILVKELGDVIHAIWGTPGHLRTRDTTQEKANALLQEAYEVFLRACEADVPEAHYALALLFTMPRNGPSEVLEDISGQDSQSGGGYQEDQLIDDYSNDEADQSDDYSPDSPTTNPFPALRPPPKHLEAEYVELLLRAASSGTEAAMFQLGVYYAHHASPPGQALAKEWVKAAAFAGYSRAMATYRDILMSEGKAELAKDWDVATEWRKVVRCKNTNTQN